MWGLALLLVGSLLTGFAAGWVVSERANLRPRNVWVSMAVLLCGAVGGPAITFRALGAGALSFALAVAAAGFATGATFRPMSRPQGTREWL
jgi:hypothetical protein